MINPMQLSSGKPYYPSAPDSSQIDLVDIVFSLAKTCRFNGQVSRERFYSVAEHSCLVANLVPKGFRKEALLHDAEEAFIGDMIRPLKPYLPDFKKITRLQKIALAERFDIPVDPSPEVIRADKIACWIEKRDILETSKICWGSSPSASENEWKHVAFGWEWRRAAFEFAMTLYTENLMPANDLYTIAKITQKRETNEQENNFTERST